MEKTVYELTLIFRPDEDKKYIDGLISKVEKVIEKSAGKVTKKDEPKLKEFAYQIEKFDKGLYIFIVFEANPDSSNQLAKLFKIEENLLRYLLINK